MIKYYFIWDTIFFHLSVYNRWDFSVNYIVKRYNYIMSVKCNWNVVLHPILKYNMITLPWRITFAWYNYLYSYYFRWLATPERISMYSN